MPKPLFQTQRRKNSLLRNLNRNVATVLQRNGTHDRVDRLREHDILTRRLQPVGLPGLPPHHLLQTIALRQLRHPSLVQRGGLCACGDVLDAVQRGVREDIYVLVRLVFGRERLLCEEERGLNVQDALAQVGELVVVGAAALVEGFVREGLPLLRGLH